MIYKGWEIVYKGWEIERVDYGFYSATKLQDCDALMKFGKNIYDLIIEIDEEL